ncbi:hypothetical protein [Marinomonas algarum]|uniref:Uncharacterized protein n=1 Tax=Marinomonas algarum TaxID=2883105 RepID=A0A9X1LEB3_9GAMM|nr:hypothetical protein [Marinomonas algarum]MCB5160855.1 hypothetical protein [Marinomonas algarum]
MGYFFSWVLIIFGVATLQSDTTQIHSWAMLIMGILWLVKKMSTLGKRKVKTKNGKYKRRSDDYTFGGYDSSEGGD